MKILSVIQPWAWALVTPGTGKTIEFRTWSTPYRGLLLVHAGKSKSMMDACEGFKSKRDGGLDPKTLAFGAVVGLVDLVNSLDGDWTVVNPTPLPRPIPLKGRLGLWAAEPELIELVAAQIDLANRPKAEALPHTPQARKPVAVSPRTVKPSAPLAPLKPLASPLAVFARRQAVVASHDRPQSPARPRSGG